MLVVGEVAWMLRVLRLKDHSWLVIKLYTAIYSIAPKVILDRGVEVSNTGRSLINLQILRQVGLTLKVLLRIESISSLESLLKVLFLIH